MRVLLLVTGRSVSQRLVEDARRHVGQAATVDVVTWRRPDEPVPGAATVRAVGPATPPPPTPLPVRALRRAVRGGVSLQFWRRVRADDDALRLASRADVVVAVDTAAIRAGWHLARRHPGVMSVYGVAALATAAVRPASDVPG